MTIGWFFKGLMQYADFRTRARRAEFWWFLIVGNFIVWAAAAFTGVVVWDAIDTANATVNLDAISGLGWAMLIMTSTLSLALVIPYWAVAVRRIHDTGRSGVWAVFIVLLPIVMLVIAVLDGEPRANRYGEDPKHLER